MAVRRSGDEKIIREILDRRDDGAGSRFPFNPANCSSLTKRFEKPPFRCRRPPRARSPVGAAMAGKAFSLCKHTGKCRRKRGSDTHVLVIHHFTNVAGFSPRATILRVSARVLSQLFQKPGSTSAAPFFERTLTAVSMAAACSLNPRVINARPFAVNSTWRTRRSSARSLRETSPFLTSRSTATLMGTGVSQTFGPTVFTGSGPL